MQRGFSRAGEQPNRRILPAPGIHGSSYEKSPSRKRLAHPGQRICQRGRLSQAAVARLSREATGNHESNSFIYASYELSSFASLPTEDANHHLEPTQDVPSSATANIDQPLLQSEHPYPAV